MVKRTSYQEPEGENWRRLALGATKASTENPFNVLIRMITAIADGRYQMKMPVVLPMIVAMIAAAGLAPVAPPALPLAMGLFGTSIVLEIGCFLLWEKQQTTNAASSRSA